MRRSSLIFWLLVLVLGPGASSAQTIQAVTETTPYTFVANGKITGSATEVVEKTLQRAGLADYKLLLYPWARAYDTALQESNVLIFLIARTPAREPLFQWVGQIMKMEYHLFRLKSTALRVDSLESAKAHTIGVMRDDVRHQYLRSKGFRRLVVSGQSLDNFQKLLRGQVDMVPLTTDDATSLCQQTGFNCADLERVLTLDEASTGLYMAFSRATAASVVERTRRAFEQLELDGQVQRILERAR